MTKDKAIAELVRIWHSPHLDLILKAGLGEVIETLKEKNQSDSLVRDSSDACKESESKLDLIRRQDAIDAIEAQKADEWIESDVDFNHGMDMARSIVATLPSAEAEQVTGKLKNPCDSLLISDSDECKEQKSKLQSAGDTFCKSQLITCNRVRECNGVCPFEDALQHADKTQTMDEQHTINYDRDWIIGCIEHDGFIHTHRFDKANQIILDALSAEAVHGEWVWSDEDASWKCGACCCVFEEIDWKPNYNFCPNCGARMNGGEEE